jgi:hypothetical protein
MRHPGETIATQGGRVTQEHRGQREMHCTWCGTAQWIDWEHGDAEAESSDETA